MMNYKAPSGKRKGEELPEVYVEGWRVYKVIPALGILHSVAVADAILSREPPACKCPCLKEDVQGPPPHGGLKCGYFAFYEKAAALGELTPYQAIAKVTALGETVLCEGGFQAERIRIEELWVVPKPLRQDTINALAERYEVEVYELEEEECKLASRSSESVALEALRREMMLRASQPQPSPIPRGLPPAQPFGPLNQSRCGRCGELRRLGPGILCGVCGNP